jgi:hypothetical protein
MYYVEKSMMTSSLCWENNLVLERIGPHQDHWDSCCIEIVKTTSQFYPNHSFANRRRACFCLVTESAYNLLALNEGKKNNLNLGNMVFNPWPLKHAYLSTKMSSTLVSMVLPDKFIII